MSKKNTQLIESALSIFDGLYKLALLFKADTVIDDAFVDERIEDVKKMVAKSAEGSELSEDEIAELKRKIKTIYAIHQQDGVAILGDYEHIDDWYKELEECDDFFWDRYKRHLLNDGFSPNIVDKLGKDTLNNMMSYIGNPKEDEQFARKGLVIGDVQSGKTANYIGLICKAVDAGYRVVFLLTGTIESLRRQTQIRVEEGFIGYDVASGEDVGVGKGDIVPFSFTSRDKDFTKGADNNTAFLIEQSSQRPYVFVIKKNVSVLKKILSAIRTNLKKGHERVKFPMLMIDDEADNASINTKKMDEDPTQTNATIRKILALFEKSNYVGFTATPFANVFIDPLTDDDMIKEDLFPRDFIYALYPPSNYNGAKKMFMDKGELSDEHMLEIIDKDESTRAKLEEIIPMKHKKEWEGRFLPESTFEAVDRFLLVNAIRDLIDSKTTTHRSMLINMSRFTRVQEHIKSLVATFLNNTRNDIKQSWKLKEKEAMKNESIKRLYDLFQREYSYLGLDWVDVLRAMNNSARDIDIVTINSSSKSKLDYKSYKNGYRVIAIGGLALSRGLTLEGLMISYFYRNSATFDVLMQMGRWFGYREGYAHLCKIYISKLSSLYYREIIRSSEQLKQDIKKMCKLKQRPVDFGIRVRNDFYNGLRITAANKMRNTKQRIVTTDFWGQMFYTPILGYEADNKNNIEVAKELVAKNETKIDTSVRFPYLREIESGDILEFLKKVEINTDYNDSFDTRQLHDFIKDKGLKFDILVMGGKCDEIDFAGSIKIKPISRMYNLVAGATFIRINRHRLGGSKDTANGLDIEIIRKIDNENDGVNEKNYLIKERNPLLIIYAVHPSNTSKAQEELFDDEDEIETVVALKDIESKKAELRFERELAARTPSYLIGFQMGFPKREFSAGSNQRYFTNINADYFKLFGSELDDEDGEE